MNTNAHALPVFEATNLECKTHPTAAATSVPQQTSSARRTSKRLAREWQTIELMVGIYCRTHHRGGLCRECKGLLDYAIVRLDRCRFGTEKPTCAKCPVHCYQKNRREQVRTVMRYAGPRMLWEHPILSLRHWVDGFVRTAAAVTSADTSNGCGN